MHLDGGDASVKGKVKRGAGPAEEPSDGNLGRREREA